MGKKCIPLRLDAQEHGDSGGGRNPVSEERIPDANSVVRANEPTRASSYYGPALGCTTRMIRLPKKILCTSPFYTNTFASSRTPGQVQRFPGGGRPSRALKLYISSLCQPEIPVDHNSRSHHGTPSLLPLTSKVPNTAMTLRPLQPIAGYQCTASPLLPSPSGPAWPDLVRRGGCSFAPQCFVRVPYDAAENVTPRLKVLKGSICLRSELLVHPIMQPPGLPAG